MYLILIGPQSEYWGGGKTLSPPPHFFIGGHALPHLFRTPLPHVQMAEQMVGEAVAVLVVVGPIFFIMYNLCLFYMESMGGPGAPHSFCSIWPMEEYTPVHR